MRSYFAPLRDRERLREVAVEQRRRVRHRRIEPEPVKRVAEVVVSDDVALRLPLRIGVEPVPRAEEPLLPALAVEGPVDRGFVVREHGKQRRQVGSRPAAGDVRFGECDVAAAQHVARERPSRKTEFAAARHVVVSRPGPNACIVPAGVRTTSSPRERRVSKCSSRRADSGRTRPGWRTAANVACTAREAVCSSDVIAWSPRAAAPAWRKTARA